MFCFDGIHFSKVTDQALTLKKICPGIREVKITVQFISELDSKPRFKLEASHGLAAPPVLNDFHLIEKSWLIRLLHQIECL